MKQDQSDKLYPKKELIDLLEKYKKILNKSTIDYLNSLIELEFSVVKDYIDIEERNFLEELEIYKKIAIYNIYNRVLNLFSKNQIQYISLENPQFQELAIYIPINEEQKLKVFDFDYKDFHRDPWSTIKIPDGFKAMKIGDISLYQTLENSKLKQTELETVRNKLKALSNIHNPYFIPRGLIGGLASEWDDEHKREIEKYKRYLNELESKEKLSPVDKKEIEMSNQIHDLLLEDYGLTNRDFEKVHYTYYEEKGNIQKKLTKTPNLSVTNHIKYI